MPEPIDYTYDDELESEIADRNAETLGRVIRGGHERGKEEQCQK